MLEGECGSENEDYHLDIYGDYMGGYYEDPLPTLP